MRGLADGQNGCKAGVGPLQEFAPLVAGLGGKQLRELSAQLGPNPAIVLPCYQALIEPEPGHELGEKLVLDRCDRHVSPIGSLIDAVVGSAAIEQVGAAPVIPHASRA